MCRTGKQKLLASGCDKVVIMHTDGYPVVYGEKIIDDKRPTVLVYGHYDVQPPGPVEEWNSQPFEPIISNGKVYARGVADDKGQFYMHVKALEILNKTNSLITNIKFLIEGEEEISSPNLNSFIKANKKLLNAGIVLISDSEMINKDTPSLETGFRGISLLELEITGVNRDLHSGSYGGAIANPIAVLAKMIASLYDENNHITVPGFYDDVLTATAEERQSLSIVPFDEDSYRNNLGIKKLFGEKGYTTHERIGIRPTIELNGIWGGYSGERVKTVIPAKAGTKISARLVPDQSSGDITEKLSNYFKLITPDSIELKIKSYSGSEPYLITPGSPGYKAAAQSH